MRRAKVFFNKGTFVGVFTEEESRHRYTFTYDTNYDGPPISLTMPIDKKNYSFTKFPAYFDGVLPEGPQLEALLRLEKLDRNDYFSQLMCIGKDLVGAFSVEEKQV